MNSKSLEEIVNNLDSKVISISNKIQEIKNLDMSELNMNFDNISILESISTNINILNDKMDDFRIELLKIQDADALNSQQKRDLREAKFQALLQKTFLPYVIYLKICNDISE